MGFKKLEFVARRSAGRSIGGIPTVSIYKDAKILSFSSLLVSGLLGIAIPGDNKAVSVGLKAYWDEETRLLALISCNDNEIPQFYLRLYPKAHVYLLVASRFLRSINAAECQYSIPVKTVEIEGENYACFKIEKAKVEDAATPCLGAVRQDGFRGSHV